MDNNIENLENFIKKQDIKFVNLKFIDFFGKDNGILIASEFINKNFINSGKIISGSLLNQYLKSDYKEYKLIPDINHFWIDPFSQDNTVIIYCDIFDFENNTYLYCDFRSLAKRAESYINTNGFANKVIFKVSPNFFLFDDVLWKTEMNGVFYQVNSKVLDWKVSGRFEENYVFSLDEMFNKDTTGLSIDFSKDICSTMSNTLCSIGIPIEMHYSNKFNSNQCVLTMQNNSLLNQSDFFQIVKYIVHNVSHNYGKTSTFMPYPVVGIKDNIMYCSHFLVKDNVNLFFLKKNFNSSLNKDNIFFYYLSGIIKHIRALQAFTMPSVNSYKGIKSNANKSIFISCYYLEKKEQSYCKFYLTSKNRYYQINICFMDSMINPYLAFSAIVMAGIDGVLNKIYYSTILDQYILSQESKNRFYINNIILCNSLEESIQSLKNDFNFLLNGNVFSKKFIQDYIKLKELEINKFKYLVHPFEFELYYNY
ncbi:glutamine synthetase beta-grasp domain-containing protein [Candidatus Legionella polyplacis]|uniref:Glutamine synthetase beta-grasp domain-containing protein n=1 Tax=Candidatus Legionella polyplacis TaxID=2005262 RepID=A0ABZ2H165_9GAMM